MESNFKLITYNNSENMHIKLTGNFNADAALLLIKSLQKNHRRFKRIFIHTNCLNTIDTAGAKAFQHGYDLPDQDLSDIVFTGEHAVHIAPNAWQIL